MSELNSVRRLTKNLAAVVLKVVLYGLFIHYMFYPIPISLLNILFFTASDHKKLLAPLRFKSIVPAIFMIGMTLYFAIKKEHITAKICMLIQLFFILRYFISYIPFFARSSVKEVASIVLFSLGIAIACCKMETRPCYSDSMIVCHL